MSTNFTSTSSNSIFIDEQQQKKAWRVSLVKVYSRQYTQLLSQGMFALTLVVSEIYVFIQTDMA